MTSPEVVPCLNNCCFSPSPPLCEMASTYDSFLTVLILFLLYLYVYVFFFFFFFPDVVVKYDSYYGVLMAYGGLQDVSGSHH
jgi:hypothetical protein